MKIFFRLTNLKFESNCPFDNHYVFTVRLLLHLCLLLLKHLLHLQLMCLMQLCKFCSFILFTSISISGLNLYSYGATSSRWQPCICTYIDAGSHCLIFCVSVSSLLNSETREILFIPINLDSSFLQVGILPETLCRCRPESDDGGQVAKNLVAGKDIEHTIQHILDIGGGIWDRDTVVDALRVASNNPERAVQYLKSVSKIPTSSISLLAQFPLNN